MFDLDTLRSDIDMVDKEIISLLDRRFNLTKQVGILKQKEKIAIENKNREQDIISTIEKLKVDNQKDIILMYKYLFLISKKGQQKCKDLD